MSLWGKLFPAATKVEIKGYEKRERLLERRGSGDMIDPSAVFRPEIKAWCKANLKKGYWIEGQWGFDDFIILKDPADAPHIVPLFSVHFRSERDALLFKTFWL